jgi:hypothetical protein
MAVLPPLPGQITQTSLTTPLIRRFALPSPDARCGLIRIRLKAGRPLRWSAPSCMVRIRHALAARARVGRVVRLAQRRHGRAGRADARSALRLEGGAAPCGGAVDGDGVRAGGSENDAAGGGLSQPGSGGEQSGCGGGGGGCIGRCAVRCLGTARANRAAEIRRLYGLRGGIDLEFGGKSSPTARLASLAVPSHGTEEGVPGVLLSFRPKGENGSRT